jgi:fructose-bisphosphate aldolase class I
MQPNVLIIGNVTKDVYLRLDNRSNNFEEDSHHVKWLDLAFNGSAHEYFRRVSVYGGASISLEVLTRFGLNASISGTPATFLDGQFIAKDVKTTYRYILCQDDNAVYLNPSEATDSTWRAPEKRPDWIYIDASAIVNRKLANEIETYLDLNSETRLCLVISKDSDQDIERIIPLLKRANLVISDRELKNTPDTFILVRDNYIEYDGQRVFWSLNDKKDLFTKLSSLLTIAASVFGALALGKDAGEALLLARANVEKSSLNNTANLERLEREIADDYYRVERFDKSEEATSEIEQTTKKLLAEGKGILAADESGGSIHKKFESMNIPDDEQHRRDYRNIFFTTPDLAKYVNGIILFDETARQSADNGQSFVDFIKDQGIVPGIKVDQGLEAFKESDEKFTKGLNGLSERLTEYYNMGARFAKWRAAFEVTDHSPSENAIRTNCEILAEYARECQTANIVPIVEPELVYDGDYPIELSIEYTGKILDRLFAELAEKQINLKACILKTNMVLAGKKYKDQTSAIDVGRYTAQVLRQHVPEELAGVVFLSGGQSVEQATDNLRAVINNGPFPWTVTFSFARALQDPALQAWKGDNTNADRAREAFKERLIANCEALKGNNAD